MPERIAPLVVIALLAVAPLAAQETPPAEPAAAAEEQAEDPDPLVPELRWGFEAKAHFRDSDDARFPSPFFPPGTVFEEVVDPGQHFEVSVLSLRLDAVWSENLVGHAKVDIIDLYDRNPTSGDRTIDVDEVWLRFGREVDPGQLPEHGGVYAKLGKFGKFERQDDRHLESYGMVSTAFNRFEDTGLEVGIDLGRHVYLKASATQGNPLFMRDPNALAGDNGTDELLRNPPVPRLGSGITILYDAEVEDLSVDGAGELGAGLGLRFGNGGGYAVDFLAWGYQRDLAPTVDLTGTFYGGDLDLLDGPVAGTGLPISGDKKEEFGANLWVYLGGLSFFGQYVDQEVAGMDRTGWEGELAWKFDLPLVWSVGGRQLFPSIGPAVRYSKLDPEFDGGSPRFPAPSLRWDWEKTDYGLRVAIVGGVDLTLEQAQNRFIVRGVERSADEFLTTVRWRM